MYLNIKHRTNNKTFRKEIGKNLQDQELHRDFLHLTQAQFTKGKTDKLDFITK